MNRLTNQQVEQGNAKPWLIITVLLVLTVALIFLILSDSNQSSLEKDSYKMGVVGDKNEERVAYEYGNDEGRNIETVEDLTGATTVVNGGNLITTDLKVVNEQGQVVQNDAVPMSPISPQLSAPLNQSDLSDSVIQLVADSAGFSPAEFRVKSEQPVTVSLTTIGLSSRLVFQDASLSALELTVPADYTMAKTFNAPSVPGEYIFYQDMPGRFQQTGKMIVE